MRPLRQLTLAGIALIGSLTSPALARPVTDCPLRDAPFSVNSPLIDVLLSPEARSVVEKATGRSLDEGPAFFMGTKPPTFSAILSVKTAALFTGVKLEAMPELDAALRKLPVTRADKIARCERYDNDKPVFSPATGKPRILLFEKINAAHAAFLAMAERKGWSIVSTESAGTFTPSSLRRFDAVIWNNISGDVLTLSQRKAFQSYLANGGSFVAIHGTAGDPVYFWDWFPDRLIGARFWEHPMNPQFQAARVVVNKDHPLAAPLPAEWSMTDEWYSFRTNPRTIGANVVLTLDEASYSPVGRMGDSLRMGDHPLAWTNCIGKGRMFYSAIGHRPETYSQPEYVALLEKAIDWAMTDRATCKPVR